MYTNRELFGPLIVPIFGLYYFNSNNKFEVKILIPLYADFNYSITEHIRTGLNAKGQLRTYNLNTPIGYENSSYAARATNDIYSHFQHGLDNRIIFQLGVGRSIGRSYRIFDEEVSFAISLAYFGDNREQLNTDFEDSWLFKIAAFYRLKL